ncbi:hypothetical protein JOF56_004513 [Kibdelosporangium banguiense]|uniref:DUF397 domain-containing protein n=1 Tax=Kibdelosporangium banguiense TaxID=1365924 RepID=A0ABS4TJP2_9PSEU|nr:DUF397 domain-containing protein [Kibdelosporangium banguiense]MBP2324128.1 hypothetical protein [Kibdelosporangium banguiense]
MSVSDPAGAAWRKSSHSGAGNDCVEIALAETQARVRDSKNPDAGTLRFGATRWAIFLTATKCD